MQQYITKCLPVDEKSISMASVLIQAGSLVAFPTETVYGLGANGLNEAAVHRIFEAKGRPQDNPLILHISQFDQLDALAERIPQSAIMLTQAYWPGPLTIIVKKSSRVPLCVTAGLDTVAIRMPSHLAARKLIDAAGVPIAAPSANRSGLPSPTRVEHVLADMQGRIPLILDGGACDFGVESTVVDLTGDVPVLLRPGAVTFEMLTRTLGRVRIGNGVMQSLGEGEIARSPGLKHKHYAPQFARVIVLDGLPQDQSNYICDFIKNQPFRCAAVVKHELAVLLPTDLTVRDAGVDDNTYAAALFDALRMLDNGKTQIIFCQSVPTDGIGLAVMNRLLRAAAFELVKVASKGECHAARIG